MLPVILAVAILIGYAGSLWWLLRRESAVVLLGLLALCGVSLSLRLVYTTDYPAGFIGDETKIVHDAAMALRLNHLFVDSQIGIPVLQTALFQAQIIPLIGANRWTMRTHSLVTSVLSTLAAFAVARALGLAIAPSLGVAAFIAVLPWSLFYGRISLGGELLFHQLLLLAALATFVMGTGGFGEISIGGLGLCLLLWDYYCGRAMMGMPLVAAVLASGRRRLFCLIIPVVALIGWLPYLRNAPATAMLGFSSQGMQPALIEHPFNIVWQNTVRALSTFIAPTGIDHVYTIRSAAMHPWLILALAGLGVLTLPRRGLFLIAGFVAGMAPGIVTGSPSAHRMLMAFPFVAIAAGCALDKFGRWAPIATSIAVLVVGAQSILLYFSPQFWLGTGALADSERTALVEALPMPPHPRLIVQQQIEDTLAMRMVVDETIEFTSVETLFPPENGASIYAFAQDAAPLSSFYQGLFGSQRVQMFGRCFVVTLEARDWSWLRQGGWSYEVRCGTDMHRRQVPFLFHYRIPDPLSCSGGTHTWRGRWHGQTAHLRLRFSGSAVVQTVPGQVAEQAGQEAALDFTATPEADMTITVVSPGQQVRAMLYEVTPTGERVPAWERVTPSGSDPS